ncbi:TPA: phage tail fiber protein, partial [Serratia marcescens]
MAVPIQTPYNIYTANGVTTVFPYEFLILDAGDLTVSINGEPVTSGFSITGVGTTNGGDVIFLTPPAAGVTVMNLREIPATRLQNYQNNGDLLAATVNNDFDRLWLAIQQSYLYLGLCLQRPLLGGPFNAHGYRIENLADPVNQQDAATKNYVLVKIAESDAAGADALARERAERIASDIAIRTETGVGLGKTVRFPYAQPMLTGDTANKVFVTDQQGVVKLVNLDDATRTDLA